MSDAEQSHAAGRAGAVLCWGEILWDLFPDKTRLGGATANVSYHLGALGASVAMVSRVGADDLGRQAKERLRSRGVDVEFVQIDSERETGAVGVEIREGEASYQLFPDRAWERIRCEDDELRRALAGAGALCYGTLSQRTPEGEESLRQALELVPESCVRICDPNLRPVHVDREILRWCLSEADVVKINDVEAVKIQRLFGVDNTITWLQRDLGVRLVALTRGANGSRLFVEDCTYDHPGFPASGGDNVGAGDAFTAVLTHLFLLGCSPKKLNAAANYYASFVASNRGATPEVPADILAKVRELSLESTQQI